MNPSPSTHSSRNGRVSFGAHGTTHSLLLERTKANTNRRPTPDSEVMVSSDEEHSGSAHGQQSALRRDSASRPATSWLSDIGQPPQGRKYSLGGLSIGSNNSQPPTPSSETTPRLTTTGQGRSGSITFTGNIWAPDRNNNSRFSDSPASPLSLAPLSSEPNNNSSFQRDRRYSGIGVDIPLKPTFKPQQQRAMSFSVAQQVSSDDEDPIHPFALNRVRTGGQLSNVQRKASLSQVREDDDDSNQGVRLHPEMDAGGSRDLLKRAVRHRTFSSNVSGYSDLPWPTYQRRSTTLPVAEDAIEDLEEFTMPESRRHSLAHVATRQQSQPIINSRSSFDRGQILQSSGPNTTSANRDHPGFGSSSDHYFNTLPQSYENPQSRAFDMPSNNNNNNNITSPEIDAVREQYLAREAAASRELYDLKRNYATQTTKDVNAPVYAIHRQLKTQNDPVELVTPLYTHNDNQEVFGFLIHTLGYFNGSGVAERNRQEIAANPRPQPDPIVPDRQLPAMLKGSERKTLHLIKFKCERAEVYYMPEGTGLQLVKGQLVICEGDRGYDIGEVEKANIELSDVKPLRQMYQEKHFIWLMMFSHARETNPTVRWALSKLDPHNASARHPEHEAEPEGRAQNFKLIKRLAIPVEFASLQEKEGDETKAKRICQQKVIEHGLTMEILDAEFQLDRHKLTYFYYAEKYINFNELVNDLFKIFKTRIWMSAVNPASFAPQPHHRGHGPPSPQQAGALTQPPPYGAAAYAQPSIVHHRNVQQAQHEASTSAQFNSHYNTQNNAYAASSVPPAFGYPAATPAPTMSFNPYAQPYTGSSAWGAPGTFTAASGTSAPWGASSGASSSFDSRTGSAAGARAGGPTTGNPRGGTQQPIDRPRHRSSNEDGRDEATRAAFYSAVTGGVQGMSLGGSDNRKDSMK
ncbi:hypothetical protein EJ05DRAFT_485625 [Pseudovirgaria hyperparasitica]|uniref:PSP1 C-terminal domain-containing protein n=1 Tax=Pseudovirgaria hyperparasitica TaxID=470096 RepID=A0A6A6W7I6_9PEZI|nr:uncharacterized protein EJ05DRAFT_485625 [Pseudovirgaria hyperparasitica]KAF2758505.1 hypothetical protein EJ05DRAFT_485625 [Pseudovirgaria hyperparasitica]